MRPIHLSTVLSRSSTGLLSHIHDISLRHAGQGHTLLFALSANFPHAEDLQEVVSRLTKFNDVASGGRGRGHTIGCLTDSYANCEFPFFSWSKDALSCAIAILDSTHCVPFYSNLRGRIQPQVGRWHSFRQTDEDSNRTMRSMEASPETNWEEVWSRSTASGGEWRETLPQVLRSVAPDIQTLLHFSNPHPDDFTQTLTHNLPRATTLGLIAAPTNFVTGRDVTLFFDSKIYSQGSVGVALLKGQKTRTKMDFFGVKRLSGPMTVTSVEGNMVNSLNSSNPTQLLLRGIEVAGLSPSISTTFKEDEQFALGVVGPSGEISHTYKITAGDPKSRGGSISLDTFLAPTVGTIVQFLHRSSNEPIQIPNTPAESKIPTFSFVTTPEPSSTSSRLSTTLPEDPDATVVIPQTFLVPSHRGFVLSRPTGSADALVMPEGTRRPVDVRKEGPIPEAWSCTLSGGMASIEYW
ncbi:hypothetical protein NLJ89_g9487 [Agrocybe chaxingu]|uniref:FIST domain-containing protein n=1 Tax=Agrocybe chaxingu TaxID=84603 RepID=A0A9W8MTH9_9AGAR|nr:hypothetical protein NLJ89_g9487 [Agrocybe chaxingu]